MKNKDFVRLNEDVIDVDGFPVIRGTVLTVKNILPYGITTEEEITIKTKDKDKLTILSKPLVKEPIKLDQSPEPKSAKEWIDGEKDKFLEEHVPKPNSSAPNRAPIITSRPVFN